MDNDFPIINLKKTGDNIKRLREKAGLSVADLQEKLQFTSPQAIYKWQWGETLPSIENLWYISRLFKVSIEEVLVEEDPQVKMH